MPLGLVVPAAQRPARISHRRLVRLALPVLLPAALALGGRWGGGGGTAGCLDPLLHGHVLLLGLVVQVQLVEARHDDGGLASVYFFGWWVGRRGASDE